MISTKEVGMKTSVEIDEEKLALARKLVPSRTLRDLLDQALDAFIAQARRQAMAEMLGTNFFEADYKKVRKKNGPSRR